MDHGPAVKLGKDNASPAKAKLGVYLFFVYLIIYIGFVAITVTSPKTMGTATILGLNLACLYGFGLIIFAIILGLAYNHVCTGLETKMNKPEADAKSEEAAK